MAGQTVNRSADSQSMASSTSLQQVVRQRPLFCFFLMAYACSWIVWIPYVLSVWSIIPALWTNSNPTPAFLAAGFESRSDTGRRPSEL
jgi:hypothetical protein